MGISPELKGSQNGPKARQYVPMMTFYSRGDRFGNGRSSSTGAHDDFRLQDKECIREYHIVSGQDLKEAATKQQLFIELWDSYKTVTIEGSEKFKVANLQG